MPSEKNANRRSFLKLATVGAAGVFSACGPADRVASTEVAGPAPVGSDATAPAVSPAAPPSTATPAVPPPIPSDFAASDNFPLGVSAGDVRHDSAILWTRYQGDGRLRLELWAIEDKGPLQHVLTQDVSHSAGGYVHAHVSGLTAGARYQYAFIETWARKPSRKSDIGHFRAPPAAHELAPLTFGVVSCTKFSHPFATLARAAERTDLDAFLLLGDTSYNDGADSLSDFRASWARTWSKPEYRALKAQVGLVATWDDHEVWNEWGPQLSSKSKVDAAREAFFENLPVPRLLQQPDRIYRSIRWGQTAEIFVLDCKSERYVGNQYISQDQMDWLKKGLADSEATFKLVMNSVPIGEFPPLFNLPVFTVGRWAGYPDQRREILEHIEGRGIPGVVWLSGDFHLGSVGRISREGPGAKTLEILAGPGAQDPNPRVIDVKNDDLFDFATGESNYVSLRLDPAISEVDVTFHDGQGGTLYRHAYIV